MKKILSIALASAMALSMTVSAFAADPKITRFASGKDLSSGYGTLGISGETAPWDGNTASNQTVSYRNTVNPNSKVVDYINLYKSMFTGDGWNATPDALLSSNEIRAAKLDVRTSVSSGSKVLDDVSIDGKNGRIKIKYQEEWVSVKDQDFNFTVYLTFNGKRATNQGMTFAGTLENSSTPVYADDDYVDISSGEVAHAQDFVPKIEVDLGNGVTIYTKLFKDKKYYGTATHNQDKADSAVFAKYPDIDNMVALKVVGLNSTGDIVKLNLDSGDYYVYDKDLDYLGRSNEMLPFSSKYYLANKKLDATGGGDVDDEDDTDDDEDDIDEPSGGSGGGGNSGSGNNGGNSPNTGASGLLPVAVLAAVVSLATLGAVARKKK